MTAGEARAEVWRRRPVLIDAAAVTVLLLTDLLVVAPLPGNPAVSTTQAMLMALAFAAVPLRTRLPVTALALTTAASSTLLLMGPEDLLAILTPLVTLYTVAVRSGRATTVVAWASTSAAVTLAGALGAPVLDLSVEALPGLSWTTAVAAVGQGLRNRRAYLAAVEERALRAERTRDEEARRRVAEERVRIARELHDVVAHHIAVVTVQAGVAQHLLATEPAAASDALAHVRRSAATVLDELGDILSVLRQPGEPAEAHAPAPGLERLDALVDSFSAAGLAVEWSLHGQPRELPPSVDLVAYRVLEEGLTNALKHGTGTALLRVEYRPTSLLLRVENGCAVLVTAGAGGAPAAAATGTGHGLLGMQERAAAVGGTLHAARTTTGAFRVQAELPLRAQP